MEKESHNLMNSGEAPGKVSKLLYYTSLSFSTIVLVVTFIVSGLANYPDPEKVGFKNQTGKISDEFYTEVTPAGWTFSIWGVIYAWQALWTVYGWSFVCRPSFPVTISPISLILYGCCNIGNVVWIYVWGNEFPEYSFPVIVFLGVCLYLAIGFESVFLHKRTHLLSKLQKFKIDLYLTRGLVLNGMVIYATWVSIATLINFTIVLEYYADVSSVNAGTVGLTLLVVEILVYFSLENSILDSYTRPIVMVYPVVIWALSGVINAHWDDDEQGNRNKIYTIVLLISAIILFIIRIILIVVFAFVRPIKYVKPVSV